MVTDSVEFLELNLVQSHSHCFLVVFPGINLPQNDALCCLGMKNLKLSK